MIVIPRMHVLYGKYDIWTKNCKLCLELLASRTFKEYCCINVRKRCCQWDSYFSTTCLTPFKNQLTLSPMLVLRRRVSLFQLSPPTESNGCIYYTIHTSEFRRTSSKEIIPWSIIIILENKTTIIVPGMYVTRRA